MSRNTQNLTMSVRTFKNRKVDSKDSLVNPPEIYEKYVNENGSVTGESCKNPTVPTSTKLEAIIDEINKVWSIDPDEKFILFSQFVCMLEFVEWRLRKERINCAKLTGNISAESR